MCLKYRRKRSFQQTFRQLFIRPGGASKTVRSHAEPKPPIRLSCSECYRQTWTVPTGTGPVVRWPFASHRKDRDRDPNTTPVRPPFPRFPGRQTFVPLWPCQRRALRNCCAANEAMRPWDGAANQWALPCERGCPVGSQIKLAPRASLNVEPQALREGSQWLRRARRNLGAP